MTPFDSALVIRLVDLAIEEDLAFGDITSKLLEQNVERTAQIIAKQELVVCGLPLTQTIVARANFSIEIDSKIQEGSKVGNQTVLQVLRGPALQITALERTILNFLQRLCGVATFTRAIVEQASSLIVLDTRKTMPGFRLLDKYATAIAGAKNHRMHLGDMILVKNNHIDSSPGDTLQKKIDVVFEKLAKRSSIYVPVEVEVRSVEELKAVLKYSPQAILLDNMDDGLISQCISLIKSHSSSILCEVSGGIDVARFNSLANLGVNAVSMGRLTTQAPNVDISLKLLAD